MLIVGNGINVVILKLFYFVTIEHVENKGSHYGGKIMEDPNID